MAVFILFIGLGSGEDLCGWGWGGRLLLGYVWGCVLAGVCEVFVGCLLGLVGVPGGLVG